MVLTLMLSLSGCGDTSSKVVFSTDSGKHPAGWQVVHQASAKTNIASCLECHGETLDGGISQVSCMSPTAVSGFKCHATDPVVSQPGCTSCHGGLPNGPYGNTAPNRKFAHGKHTALTGCDTCHLNAGTRSAGHARATAAGAFTPATVNLDPGYRAKTGTSFAYDPASGKCSGTNCHGGKDSPSWSSGMISLGADCLTCHEQGTAPATPQYNSFYSGTKSGRNLHFVHLNSATQTVVCIDCHNIGILSDYQQHFGGIRTNTFTAPENTVGNKGSALPTKIRTYTTGTKTCGTVACHPDVQWVQP